MLRSRADRLQGYKLFEDIKTNEDFFKLFGDIKTNEAPKWNNLFREFLLY